jgi:trigger factor
MDMQVEFEEITSVKRKLSVEIPADTANTEFERVAKDYRKYARLPGFRQGKAPLQLIKRRFADDIRGEVLKKLIPESYERAIREQDVHPLGQPNLENVEAKEGQPLTFEAHFEILPEFELPKYKGLQLTVEDLPVTDADVEEQLESAREQSSQLVAVEDRSIQDADYVTLDLVGEYIDLEESGQQPSAPAIKDNHVVVQVGDPGTHKAFNEALAGMSIGEEKTFDVDYPDDYPEDSLKGRKVRFTAKVNEIKQKELPELNDEFAKDMGDYESLDDLRDRVRQDLEVSRKRNRENEISKAATKQLADSVDFDVPDVLVDERSQERLEELARRVASQGIDPSKANIDWRKVREDMRSDVVQEVKTRLILDALARQEGIEIGDEELDKEITSLAEALKQPVEKIRQAFSGPTEVEGLKTDIRRRKALAIIIDQAKIKT